MAFSRELSIDSQLKYPFNYFKGSNYVKLEIVVISFQFYFTTHSMKNTKTNVHYVELRLFVHYSISFSQRNHISSAL